jgi:hypothetical protein
MLCDQVSVNTKCYCIDVALKFYLDLWIRLIVKHKLGD